MKLRTVIAMLLGLATTQAAVAQTDFRTRVDRNDGDVRNVYIVVPYPSGIIINGQAVVIAPQSNSPYPYAGFGQPSIPPEAAFAPYPPHSLPPQPAPNVLDAASRMLQVPPGARGLRPSDYFAAGGHRY